MPHDTALPADETLAAPREHWSRQEIVRTIIHAMVEANGKVQAVPAGKAADHILAYLAPALSRPSSSGRDEVLEEAALVADRHVPEGRNGAEAGAAAIAGVEIAESIRALKSQPPTTLGGDVDPLRLAREAFLSLIADADRWEEEVDGDVDGDGRHVMTVDYVIHTGYSQLAELVDALGIPGSRYMETLKDRIDRAVEA